jgi:hypothetical protein
MACASPARDIRRTGRHWIIAGALKHIGPVDTRGSDANQQLAAARHWRRPFTQTQDVGRTVRSDFNCFHQKFQ